MSVIDRNRLGSSNRGRYYVYGCRFSGWWLDLIVDDILLKYSGVDLMAEEFDGSRHYCRSIWPELTGSQIDRIIYRANLEDIITGIFMVDGYALMGEISCRYSGIQNVLCCLMAELFVIMAIYRSNYWNSLFVIRSRSLGWKRAFIF